MTQKILVTGAGGYIGSCLVPKLLEQGYTVVAVDLFLFGKDKLPAHARLTRHTQDVRNMPAELFQDVYAVIDLVAISNDPAGEFFNTATWEINHAARVRTAALAKQHGVQRYILPSSCSIYGSQPHPVVETSTTNPLTTYAKANERAEQDILPLGDENFCVTVLRQATVYGYAPRMRFDLAVNGMTYGAWKDHRLPLMRDGKQYRPMVHVQDTTDVMIRLLTADPRPINQEIFNVGGNDFVFKIVDLANQVASTVDYLTNQAVTIEWYGDPDQRTYDVRFDKIAHTLGWTPTHSIASAVTEIVTLLEAKALDKTTQTLTLAWYKSLGSACLALSD